MRRRTFVSTLALSAGGLSMSRAGSARQRIGDADELIDSVNRIKSDHGSITDSRIEHISSGTENGDRYNITLSFADGHQQLLELLQTQDAGWVRINDTYYQIHEPGVVSDSLDIPSPGTQEASGEFHLRKVAENSDTRVYEPKNDLGSATSLDDTTVLNNVDKITYSKEDGSVVVETTDQRPSGSTLSSSVSGSASGIEIIEWSARYSRQIDNCELDCPLGHWVRGDSMKINDVAAEVTQGMVVQAIAVAIGSAVSFTTGGIGAIIGAGLMAGVGAIWNNILTLANYDRDILYVVGGQRLMHYAWDTHDFQPGPGELSTHMVEPNHTSWSSDCGGP